MKVQRKFISVPKNPMNCYCCNTARLSRIKKWLLTTVFWQCRSHTHLTAYSILKFPICSPMISSAIIITIISRKLTVQAMKWRTARLKRKKVLSMTIPTAKWLFLSQMNCRNCISRYSVKLSLMPLSRRLQKIPTVNAWKWRSTALNIRLIPKACLPYRKRMRKLQKKIQRLPK